MMDLLLMGEFQFKDPSKRKVQKSKSNVALGRLRSTVLKIICTINHY